MLIGSQIAADVVVEHKGFGGSQVLLLVEGPEGVIGTEEIELPRQGDSTVVKAHFTVSEEGPHLYRFRIAAEEGEMVRENNEREVLIIAQDRSDKVLYIEGEPSDRVGFMRDFAIDDDENITLGVFMRMAENKFHRMGFESEEELAGGFPTTRDELFQYKALVMGSWESDFFTADQRQMIHDFVSQRGGGLLVLGGRNSLGEGGWADTPVADVLPVILEAPFASTDSPFYTELQIMPTLFGRTHPVTQMADSVDDNLRHWDGLPTLGIVNRIAAAKPGAVTILEGVSDDLEDPQVVLAFHRFGRGKALVFTPVNTWYWQMAFDIPLEDMTHEDAVAADHAVVGQRRTGNGRRQHGGRSIRAGSCGYRDSHCSR